MALRSTGLASTGLASTGLASTGLEMRPRWGAAWHFDPGSPVFDFAYTGGVGRWAVYESLAAPEDLRAWLAGPPVGVELTHVPTEDDLLATRELRDAIHHTARALARTMPVPRAARAAINRAAAEPPLVPVLDGAGSVRWSKPATVRQALSSIAREAIDLFGGPLAERIRECGSDDCELVFVDTSRPGRRRWCSMERCGNRHKVRAFRERE